MPAPHHESSLTEGVERTPGAIPSRAPAPRLAPDGLVTLLDHVLHATGTEVAIEDVRGVALRARPGDVGDGLTSVTNALSELGFRCRRLHGDVDALVEAVGPEHPAVVIDDRGQWVLLVARRGRRFSVETSAHPTARWVTRAELTGLLPVDHGGAFAFLAVDPPSLIRTSEGQEGPAATGGVVSPWRRLAGLVIRERQDVSVALIYAAGAGLLSLTTPLAVQALVNTVAFGTLMQPVLVLATLLLAGLALAGVLRGLQAWVVEMLQRRVFLRLVDDLAHRLPRVPASAFDRAHGPELVNRFFDIFTIQKAASSLLISGLEVVLTAIVGMLVLAFYHPLLLAFDVLLIGIVSAILFGLGRGATPTAVAESKAKYEVASWLEEIARHPAAFKLAGGPHLARDRSDALAAAYLTRRKRHFRIVFRQLAGALSLHAFASAGILGIGGFLVINRQLTLGQLVAAELIVTMVVVSFAKIGKHLETTYDLVAALDKVGQLVDLPLETFGHAVCPSESPRGARMRSRELRHAFEGQAPLLESVDIDVEPAERVAIRGRSGGGLSTLADILLGLRRADGGTVEIDGVDMDDLDREYLRSRAALVRSDEVVAGTVFDNVAFGRRDIGIIEVRSALRQVGLRDEVMRLDGGIDAKLMPGGAPLSRNQALRLVLARAIAGRPSLLVIDGALDGLDPDSRDHALTTLLDVDAPWTLLVITSSDEIASRMDRTLHLVDGELSAAAKEED